MTENLDDARKFVLRQMIKVNDSMEFDISNVKDEELDLEDGYDCGEISPEDAFNELKKGLFNKVGKNMGFDLRSTDLNTQRKRWLVIKVINGLVSFLLRDKWILIYASNEFAIFSKLKDDVLDSVKIPFDINMSHNELLSTYLDVFKAVRGRYNKYDFAREIFGKEKVDEIVAGLENEGEVDIDG